MPGTPEITEDQDIHIGFEFDLEKSDLDRRMVFGLVTGEEKDKQGDILEYEGSLKALTNWSGNMRNMHNPHHCVGKRVQIIPYPKHRQIGLVSRVSRTKAGDDTLRQIRDGELIGYSIKGPPRKTAPPPAGARRLVKEWECEEVSFVDNPAYLQSKLQVMLAKRAEDGLVLASEVLAEPEAWGILVKGDTAVFAGPADEEHEVFLKAQGFSNVGSISVFDDEPGNSVTLDETTCPRCAEGSLVAELTKSGPTLACNKCGLRYTAELRKSESAPRRSLPGLLLSTGLIPGTRQAR